MLRGPLLREVWLLAQGQTTVSQTKIPGPLSGGGSHDISDGDPSRSGGKNRVSKSKLDRDRVGPVTLFPDPGELGVGRLGWGWDRAPLSRWWGGG